LSKQEPNLATSEYPSSRVLRACVDVLAHGANQQLRIGCLAYQQKGRADLAGLAVAENNWLAGEVALPLRWTWLKCDSHRRLRDPADRVVSGTWTGLPVQNSVRREQPDVAVDVAGVETTRVAGYQFGDVEPVLRG
jgi:hypothetical protein